ncbi:hypothetical protein BJF92_16680 [Rhizobium rhizosphaerae]|uniref:Uncharacterized protein n=1 Tax=Xaviernesmea rhizosphaerae TaxID=1672749 RepID=A0A1Q9AIF5_9HYPH|nr:hypothetical protein [Xaviernesmea rhizosphaerae]OLP55035.1 hypothetical protein BJF92_16680 [Xaviernesmea rhizosphaerae]
MADTATSLRVYDSWQQVALVEDRLRPQVLLASSSAFRLRVRNQLYLVAPGAPLAVDFAGASLVEIKAVSGLAEVSIIRSAGGAQP